MLLSNPGDERGRGRVGPAPIGRGCHRWQPRRERHPEQSRERHRSTIDTPDVLITLGFDVRWDARASPGAPVLDATVAQPASPFHASTATVEVFSMKFRVARDDLADAVAWVAKSLPTRPPVPVLGGILLEVQGSTLTVAGFDYEVSTRADRFGGHPGVVPGRRRRRRRAADRAGAGLRPAAGRDHPVAAGQAGRPGGRSGRGCRSSPARPGSPCRPCRSRTTRRCRRCRARPARSMPRCSPRRSRRPRSPPAGTTRCRC